MSDLQSVATFDNGGDESDSHLLLGFLADWESCSVGEMGEENYQVVQLNFRILSLTH